MFQYAPNDKLVVTADALYSDFDVESEATSYGHWFTAPNIQGVGDDGSLFDESGNRRSPTVDANGTIIVSNDPANDLSLNMNAYPNPVSSLAFVDYEVTAVGNVNFALMNTMGQKVWHKQHSNVAAGKYNFNIDVSTLAAGVYFLRMDQQGQMVTKKLIVE